LRWTSFRGMTSTGSIWISFAIRAGNGAKIPSLWSVLTCCVADHLSLQPENQSLLTSAPTNDFGWDRILWRGGCASRGIHGAGELPGVGVAKREGERQGRALPGGGKTDRNGPEQPAPGQLVPRNVLLGPILWDQGQSFALLTKRSGSLAMRCQSR
jgi:hypothetical protein